MFGTTLLRKGSLYLATRVDTATGRIPLQNAIISSSSRNECHECGFVATSTPSSPLSPLNVRQGNRRSVCCDTVIMQYSVISGIATVAAINVSLDFSKVDTVFIDTPYVMSAKSKAVDSCSFRQLA